MRGLRRLPVPGQHQDNPTDEANATGDGPNRHGMFLLFVDLERAELHHVLFRSEARVASVGEQNNPDRDQNDPENSGWFHETGRLKRTASRNQIDDQDDDSDDQEQVNEPAADMADETEEPENQENNEDSPEHMFSFELVYFFRMRVPGWERLERSFPGDQLDDQDDHRGQKNQVNEIPDGIDVNESQQREDQQHNKDSPEHMFSFELVYFASHAGVRLRLKIFGKPGRRPVGAAK
jgi:hypothetical protein